MSNLSRRSFLGSVLALVAAPYLPKLKVKLPALPEPVQAAPLALGTQLSYITRRSYLSPAIAQIYNTSPVMCRMLSENAKIK